MGTIYQSIPVRDAVAPHLEKVSTARGVELIVRSNGSIGCYGGWRVQIPVKGGTGGHIEVIAEHKDLDHPEDAISGVVLWMQRDEKGEFLPWDAWGRQHCDILLSSIEGPDRIRLTVTTEIPDGAEMADIWLLLRWSPKGEVRYVAPKLTEVPVPQTRQARLSLVTGPLSLRDPSVQRDLDFHLRLTEKALGDNPDFVGYPEAITSGTVPGKETETVAQIASENQLTIALPMIEIEGELRFNSVVLIGPSGDVIGKYRKVHLAYPLVEAMDWLTMPGNEFPVYETPVGRVGMNICMDSSTQESAMMVGLHGADILFLPIMGDIRSDGCSIGLPVFSMDRWLVIQRCRAMDNQLYMAVARNSGQGSCVIDPWGDVLALNEGNRDHITADIALGVRRTTWDGCELEQMIRMQRRPHLYADLAAPRKIY
jgi:predicted amidohydrolase